MRGVLFLWVYNEIMSDAATRKDIDEVLSVISDFADRVDDRFNKDESLLHKFESRFDRLDARLDSIETELGDLKSEISELRESHNRLLNTVDGFVARIDKYETEMAARDRQFEKLVEWAREVSKKTGIPLDNL